MASTAVPGLDLAPSVPSRVVTIDVIDMTEGHPAAGATVDFILPQDLHARADKKIIKAGTTRLTLDSDGHGEIRLPAYSDATRPEDWVILVKKSWAPYAYPIRVPTGTTKISLSAIDPPVEVTDAMAKYVITDATAHAISGVEPSASVTVSGGIADFLFTLPYKFGDHAPFSQGTLPTGADLNEYKTAAHSGLWHANSQATASSVTNKPSGLRSNSQFELLVLMGATGAQMLIPYGYYDSPMFYMRRTISAGSTLAWEPWEEFDASKIQEAVSAKFDKGSVRANADLNDYKSESDSGLWRIRSQAAAANTQNMPPGLQVQGSLLVIGGPTPAQIFFPYGFYGGPQYRSVSNISGPVWSDWAPLGGTSGSGSGSVAPVFAEPSHSIRQNLMRIHYGRVSTGGKAAIALRCDHGLRAFRDTVLPLCEARGILPAMAYNPRNWHYPENDGVSAADLNSWVLAGRVEIMNHSANHLGADTEEALHDQIVGGLREIEAELPAAKGKVWGFAPPGVSTGNYGGFDEGRTPEGWATVAGQLIAAHHAIGYGYIPETTISPLDGHIRDGRRHVSVEKAGLASVKSRVDEAIAAKGSLQLMVHPNELGKPGLMSVADFTALLDYVASKSSQIMWLSPYEMAIATL